jgi:hypothetical protein
MLRISTRTFMVPAALVVALASAVVQPALAQRNKNDKDKKPAEALTAAQKQEAAPLAKLADEVMKGKEPGTYLVTPPKDPAKDAPTQPAPAPITLAWKADFLKADQNLIWVPFTVTVDPGAAKLGSVAAYLRVAPKGATGPASADPKTPPYAFEDAYFTELRGGGAAGLAKLTRGFWVAPGAYDVYFTLRERPAGGTAADAPVRVVILKQDVVVPNYHADELQTSSVIVADKIEALSAPVAPEAMKERPYVLGESEITPAADLKFKKTEELQVVFQIYGAKAVDKKPDVQVEYAFFRRDAGGEKPFNKTAPQVFNATSLPPGFDAEMGHQLQTGQGVPLQSFEEGDYRLEIKVIDNKAQKSVTRDVLFTVQAAS